MVTIKHKEDDGKWATMAFNKSDFLSLNFGDDFIAIQLKTTESLRRFERDQLDDYDDTLATLLALLAPKSDEDVGGAGGLH
jgi:hypothetical protein